MTATLIDGKAISARTRDQVALETAEFIAATGVVPQLATVLVGDDPASAVYVRNKHQACEKVGFRNQQHTLPASTTQAELLELVARLNSDPEVHGILIQLPLPRQINEQAVLDAVHPLKDVDAFHPENVGLIVQGRPRFLPCTPAGVQVLLREAGVKVDGAHVVVLGRSEIVGKPMGMILIQKGETANATVTICHSRTQGLADILRTADIVVAAIGRANFVTADMIRPGATVIDVGINRVGDKLAGDVDFAAVKEVAGAITPVPGGVGPMTIAMLMRNTLTGAKLQAGYS